MIRGFMKKQKRYGEPMTPRDIALNYLKSFSSGDPDIVASHVTKDFENNQMGVFGMCFKGRDLYREKLIGFLSSFRNIEYIPEDVIVDGDRVVIAYRMATENNLHSVDIRGVMIITISGDRVSVRSDYWDGLSYLKQVGIGL
ncbi:MAG: hypothetical protein COB49_04610 [Alphaproteobacteria bacterium]|nr:MAG: hypothetical protein COB49_04610 [Alphaproteobacteria bacterium]